MLIEQGLNALFTAIGFTFNLFAKSLNFGYSQTDKLDASIELKDVILGRVTSESLERYKGPLNMGRLNTIFTKLIQSFTNTGLQGYKEQCTSKALLVMGSLVPK